MAGRMPLDVFIARYDFADFNHAVADACAYRLCHPNIVPKETAEPSD